jgi:hypothetical protein
MSISAAEAGKINAALPELQSVGVGTELKAIQDKAAYSPIYIKKVISADATGAGGLVTIPYNFELVDVIVQCTASNGGGTVTIKSGTNAITDAIAMATDTNITRAGTINDAYSTITTASTIYADANGANDRGIVILVGYRA